MTFKEVVSHVIYCALFSQLSCHCHMISAHSRLSAHQKRCSVVLSLEVLVLGPLAWLVLRWHIMMAPCGQTIHFLAKNQREKKERARGKGPMVSPPPGDLGTHTHMHADTHT